jgi:hypothetical protein
LSDVPPAAKGTTRRTDLVGQPCAAAGAQNVDATSNAARAARDEKGNIQFMVAVPMKTADPRLWRIR